MQKTTFLFQAFMDLAAKNQVITVQTLCKRTPNDDGWFQGIATDMITDFTAAGFLDNQGEASEECTALAKAAATGDNVAIQKLVGCMVESEWKKILMKDYDINQN